MPPPPPTEKRERERDGPPIQSPVDVRTGMVKLGEISDAWMAQARDADGMIKVHGREWLDKRGEGRSLMGEVGSPPLMVRHAH